jgi:proline racemase
MRFSHLIHAIDVHAAGWPLRLVNGVIRGDNGDGTFLYKEARKVWEDEDSIVHWLQKEPRGHAAMRVAIIDRSLPDEIRLLVFDSEGPCRGDALDGLCAITAVAELNPGNALTIRMPEQRFRVQVRMNGSTAEEILVEGEGAECVAREVTIRAGDRDFIVDRAICGNEYVVLNAEEAGIELSVANKTALERIAGQIAKEATSQRRRVEFQRHVHSDYPSPGLRIVILETIAERCGDLRMAVFNENGEMLRAPEGGAIGATLAVKSRGKDGTTARDIRVEGLSGGKLHGVVTAVGKRDGIEQLRWELRGRAFVTGSHQFVVDPGDPLPRGFLLR